MGPVRIFGDGVRISGAFIPENGLIEGGVDYASISA